MKWLPQFILCVTLAAGWNVFAFEPTQLSNSRLALRIDAAHGTLLEFTDRNSHHDFVGPGADALWQIELAGRAAPLVPADARAFTSERLAGKTPGLKLTWSRFPQSVPELRVEAIVTLSPKEPLSQWKLRISGLPKETLQKVRYPRLQNLAAQPNERLAVPLWMGQLSENPRELLASNQKQGSRHEWPYPGLLSMQCLAFYAEQGAGLYVACDDTQAFCKAFAVTGSKDANISCEVVHLPEFRVPQSTAWELPYQVIIGTFRGDWITAAEQYRSWATNQHWARQSRVARGLVPQWALDTGLWVWNRGRSDMVLGPTIELQKKAGMPVSVFWHWWHGCSYDTGFPEYLPPREGAERFQKAVSAARENDVRALVYMNQRLWGMRTSSWTNQNAERYAVKAADGKVHPEVYNTFTKAPCASMCMGTEFWRDHYASLAERATCELGVAGIYMDQACTSLACYDPQHNHPLGGGAYWMRGFQKLQADIRQRCAGSAAVVLAGEGCGESWLPYLDLMLSLQVSKERYAGLDGWETIPFFHAVYHACSVTYGNYSSLTMPPYDDLWPAEFAPKEPLKLLDRKFSRQFLLEQARAFVWGQQPTIANFLPFNLEQRPEEIGYVLRLAKLRNQAREYLLRGTFLRAPELDCPTTVLDMSRLSIYAGQQGGLREFRKEYPLAIAGAWRSQDGHVAVALASIADEALNLRLRLDPGYYGMSRRARISRLDENGSTSIGRLPRSNVLQVLLPPRGACLLQFAR